MKEAPKNEFEKYKEQRRWAHDIATKFGIELDKGEEHFVIPIKSDDGKEKKYHLPTHYKIHIKNEDGTMDDTGKDTEDAIRAIQQYPEESLRTAIKKIKDRHS